ncbi:MAG: hypothetical protein RMM08_03810 [Armatimonadota bacterium]|nr:hypothetical protein [bacterium]MDW8320469.1 hypothetical protein [Armatimonadota bacterium]
MLKRLWEVTLLVVLASNLCLAHYRFNGTIYQLRWGQTEGSPHLLAVPIVAVVVPGLYGQMSHGKLRKPLLAGGRFGADSLYRSRRSERRQEEVYFCLLIPKYKPSQKCDGNDASARKRDGLARIARILCRWRRSGYSGSSATPISARYATVGV